MNNSHLFGIAVLVVAIAFSIQLLQPKPTTVNAATPVLQDDGGLEYATLSVVGNDQVVWRVGGNQIVRTESVARTFNTLGGSGRATTFVDLLNQIGSQGWILIEKDDDLWIFSRPAS